MTAVAIFQIDRSMSGGRSGTELQQSLYALFIVPSGRFANDRQPRTVMGNGTELASDDTADSDAHGWPEMSIDPDDPHCPECGEPIGQTATYCMHCSADLTEERAAADEDEDGVWDGAETGRADAGAGSRADATASGDRSADTPRTSGEGGGVTADDEQLLDPDGVVDNTLTAVVGIVVGVVIGVVGTVVLLALTGNAWALLFGLCAWLGSTVYLARRRTVQGAIAKGGYAAAVVLLVVPLVAFSPLMDVEGGLGERGSAFLVLLVFVAVPAGVAAAIGWLASRYTPAGDAGAR